MRNRKIRNSLSDLLNDVQRHHGMNLPNSILGQPLSAIGLVFGRVPYIQNALPITVMIGVSFWVLPMRSDAFSVRQNYGRGAGVGRGEEGVGTGVR